jgi:hypothetical protein
MTASKAYQRDIQIRKQLKGQNAHTPGGGLKNKPRSDVHLMSGDRLHVKPHRETLILDSLAVVSGTTREVNESFSKGFAADV